jgi:hypothetical protein
VFLRARSPFLESLSPRSLLAFHLHSGEVSVSPDQLPDKDILAPLAQQYFKEDVGAASRIDISYFRENFVQDRSSFHCYVEYLTNRLARVSNDYAPDRRAAKRPDELELVIFAAVLLESRVKPILRALARTPITHR